MIPELEKELESYHQTAHTLKVFFMFLFTDAQKHDFVIDVSVCVFSNKNRCYDYYGRNLIVLRMKCNACNGISGVCVCVQCSYITFGVNKRYRFSLIFKVSRKRRMALEKV
mgnify:CR=1 FL=1